MKADACAESLYDKDTRKFWINVFKISNNKATNHVICVNGHSGPDAVVGMWKNHFESLYNSKSAAAAHAEDGVQVNAHVM